MDPSRSSLFINKGALRNSLMQMLATPPSDMVLNRQNADTDKMVRFMASRQENPVLVIPVNELAKEHVDIDRPLFFTFRHHAIFAGHEQFEVNGKQMTIIELKSFNKTYDEIMRYVDLKNTEYCGAYFIVNARDVNEAIRSVQDYAKKKSENVF